MRANERVAQSFSLHSWLFWPTVDRKEYVTKKKKWEENEHKERREGKERGKETGKKEERRQEMRNE